MDLGGGPAHCTVSKAAVNRADPAASPRPDGLLQATEFKPPDVYSMPINYTDQSPSAVLGSTGDSAGI